MKLRLTITAFLMACGFCGTPWGQEHEPVQVTLCQLLESPEKFDGKSIVGFRSSTSWSDMQAVATVAEGRN